MDIPIDIKEKMGRLDPEDVVMTPDGEGEVDTVYLDRGEVRVDVYEREQGLKTYDASDVTHI